MNTLFQKMRNNRVTLEKVADIRLVADIPARARRLKLFMKLCYTVGLSYMAYEVFMLFYG